MCSLSKITSLEKTDFLFANGLELSIPPLLGMDLHEPMSILCRDFGWSNLVQVLNMQSQSLRVPVCNGPVNPGKSSIADAAPSGSYNFTPSSAMILEPHGEKEWVLHSFLFSEHSPVMCLCINLHLLQKQSSQMRVERCPKGCYEGRVMEQEGLNEMGVGGLGRRGSLRKDY